MLKNFYIFSLLILINCAKDDAALSLLPIVSEVHTETISQPELVTAPATDPLISEPVEIVVPEIKSLKVVVSDTVLGELINIDSGRYIFLTDNNYLSEVSETKGVLIIGKAFDSMPAYYLTDNCIGQSYVDSKYSGTVGYLWQGSEAVVQPPLIMISETIEKLAIKSSLESGWCSKMIKELYVSQINNNDISISGVYNQLTGEIKVELR